MLAFFWGRYIEVDRSYLFDACSSSLLLIILSKNIVGRVSVCSICTSSKFMLVLSFYSIINFFSGLICTLKGPVGMTSVRLLLFLFFITKTCVLCTHENYE